MEELRMGARIARYRKENGLTQEALANRLGVTNQAVSKWEGDVCCPDIQLLPELADALGLSLDALFGRETPEPPAAEKVKEETSPIGIVEELPWADDESLHAVLYQGHRLLQSEGIPERNGGGLLHLLAGRRDAQQVVLRFTGTARDIYSDFAVHCEGEVSGSIQAGDGVTCGNVEALSLKLEEVLSRSAAPIHYDMDKYDWDKIAAQVFKVYTDLKCN